MNSIKSRAGAIIVTNRTPLYEALVEMTRAFFAYWAQVDANSQLSVVMTFEIKPIYEPENNNDESTEQQH